MNKGLTDAELLEWCIIKFGYKNFTGNDFISAFKLTSNQIHLQLFRISKKSKYLNRYVLDNKTYYFITNSLENQPNEKAISN